MISEGSMAVGNSALRHRNKLHYIKIENSYFLLVSDTGEWRFKRKTIWTTASPTDGIWLAEM